MLGSTIRLSVAGDARLRYEFTENGQEFCVKEAINAPGPNFIGQDSNGNVRDSVAQLVLITRPRRDWLSSYTFPNGPRRTTPRVIPEMVTALVHVCPTISELLAELRRVWAELMAILRTYPPKLSERKNYLWWITVELDEARITLNTGIERIQLALQEFSAK